MKTPNVILFFLLFFGSIAGAAEVKSPAVLFQEGLYAEETEGNLEKAMEIYQQVIEQAGETERIAAQATYQLGMCYLKKDQKEKAAEYFQQVVSQYPAQKPLVEQAEQQLKKLGIAPYTQEIHFDIDPNGLMRFWMPMHLKNNGNEPLSTYQFSNSDFVSLTKMTDINDKPIGFTTTHEGTHFRYFITFNPPIKPGQDFVYNSYGTMKGLINPVADMENTYQYYMQHSPNSGQPTLRIETYLLPKGTEVISTVPPSMKRMEKDGRIELSVEKVIPPGGSITTSFQYKLESKAYLTEEIQSLIKEMHDPDAPRFVALNKLIKIGAPAVESLIIELQKSQNWQIAKALGAIGDKRAIDPLIAKWQEADTSPMNDVIAEALANITGNNFGKDREKWVQWWNESKNNEFDTPDDTIKGFMAAAIKLDANEAMSFVATDSHDYNDIKQTLINPNNPFNIMFRKIDPAVPVKIIETKITDNMCEVVWQITLKEDFTIEGKTFKTGETFTIDGNLHKYGDKWLITGI